jgi:AraC-like DNA-binding protein
VSALHARFIAHRYPRHAHDYFVIGYVESGNQSYFYRGAKHLTPAGQLFLVNPDEPHTGEAASPNGYVYKTLCLGESYLSKLVEDIAGRPHVPYFKGAVIEDAILADRFTRVHRCLTAESGRAELEMALLNAVAHLIARNAERPVGFRRIREERRAVKIAREYIETHHESNLSLSKVASVAGLSPYHFARTFQGETGLPPHMYLEGVRIRRARKLLDQGRTIVFTALSVGYSDQSHLTRRFKLFTGVTPGQYLRATRAPATQQEDLS